MNRNKSVKSKETLKVTSQNNVHAKESPFNTSTKIHRSPIKPLPDHQSRVTTRSITAQLSNETCTTTDEITEAAITSAAEPNHTEETTQASSQKIIKMDQQKLQQQIASFVPEFSGESNRSRATDLQRFLGTSESIYDQLKADEKQIFDRIIKFRLTGDAFMRISKRGIKTFQELKNTLTNMYTETYSLTELEHNLTNIQQCYGETIRNYGYRLLETLEQYKTAYKHKYEIENLDRSYSTHLNTTAVQAFKRGINNIILRDKIATHKAENVDSIINETEEIEKLLSNTSHTQFNSPQQTHINNSIPVNAYTNQSSNQLSRNNHPRRNQVTCNYCNKPNHTWDVCRTRIFREQHQSNYQFNRLKPYPQRSETAPYKPQNYQTTDIRNYQPHKNNINTHYQHNGMHQQLNQLPIQPRENWSPNNERHYTQTQPYQPNYKQNGNQNFNISSRNSSKYCTYCKILGSHTFDECRNKLRDKISFDKPNQPEQNNGTNNLATQFRKLRINSVLPPLEEADITSNEYQSENSNGSGQR